MKNKNIVKRIKRAMLEKDINQSELAKKLGITKSVISNWFIGNRNPKMETLEKIAKVLNVPVNYFLDDKQEKEIKNSEDVNIKLILELIKEIRTFNEKEITSLKEEIFLLKKEIELLKK